MKQTGFKFQIEQELSKKNWEIAKIDSNTEWWDDENWLMRFKFDRNVSFYVCFIVDPQFEKHGKNGQGIWEVKATKEFPRNWNDNESTITSISMSTRKFEIKLKEFIADLEKFKKGKTPTNIT